jgi:hypothetical protein
MSSLDSSGMEYGQLGSLDPGSDGRHRPYFRDALQDSQEQPPQIVRECDVESRNIPMA